jgi:hypothetical protein
MLNEGMILVCPSTYSTILAPIKYTMLVQEPHQATGNVQAPGSCTLRGHVGYAF